MSYYTPYVGGGLPGAASAYPQPHQSYLAIIAQKTAIIAAGFFMSCILFSSLPESLAITFSAIVLLGTLAFVLPDSILTPAVYHSQYVTPLPWYHRSIFAIPQFVSGVFRRPSAQYTGAHAPVGTGAYTPSYAAPQPYSSWRPWAAAARAQQPSAPPLPVPAASPLSRNAQPFTGGQHAPVGRR